MDYGGVDRRRTKNDLKKKRINRGYKKGGKFRTSNVDEETGEKKDKMGKVVVEKKNGSGKGVRNSVPSKKRTKVLSSSGKKRKY